MTTRPGYVWDATASEWVEIGQAAVVAPVAYQASEPSSPATGDIWIDSDDEVPSVDSTLYYRWTKTMSGGETSLSGTDNNSLALKYTPGYESVFINGVLQVRGSDYVATTGTTVTGLIALTASDVVMVESIIAYSVGDTYTQTQIGSLLDAKSPVSTTGLVLLSTSIFSTAASVSVDNCFSSTYKNYRISLTISSYTAANTVSLRFRASASDNSTANYTYVNSYITTALTAARASGATSSILVASTGQTSVTLGFDVFSPQESANTFFGGIGGGSNISNLATGSFDTTTQFDGISILGTSMTGTIKVYGYK
jgi:hypothetical protein